MGRTRKKKRVAEKVPITAEPIPCELRSISEYPSLLPSWNPDKFRKGRYAGSAYSSTHKKEYAVIVYIDGEFEPLRSQGMLDEEILAGCIATLNKAPPRKKYAKKAPKAPYGDLRILQWQAKEYSATGKLSYVVVLGTNQKKNKNFWGVGLGKK